MRPRILLVPIAILACAGFAIADDPIEVAGYKILHDNCFGCHGGKQTNEGVNVHLRDTLVGSRDEGDPVVIPKKPGDSRLIQVVKLEKGEKGHMPKGKDKLNREAIETLEKWVEAGFGFPEQLQARRPIGVKAELQAILGDLQNKRLEDQPFQRYFTLSNLWNNKDVGQYDEKKLRLARAALSKAINSLSLKPQIFEPREIPVPGPEAGNVLFGINVRELDWDRSGAWNILVLFYPYRLDLSQLQDQEARNLAAQVEQRTGTDTPTLRIDWFVANATRSPLYEFFLELPKDLKDLERKTLSVDPEGDFLKGILMRAGFQESGVAYFNRVVDRHLAHDGYFWKSYDFTNNVDFQNIAKFPLGPRFEHNLFNAFAFQHAAGEMIFRLPNHLQGYYVANAAGNRLREVDSKIARDNNEIAGSTVIVNGLSCMGCHDKGMNRLPPDDFLKIIARDAQLDNTGFQLIGRLARAPKFLDDQLTEDTTSFLDAVEKAAGEYLKPDEGFGPTEPIWSVANSKQGNGYLNNLGVNEVAAELGVTPERVRMAVENNPLLSTLGGLAPLKNGGRIGRDIWERPIPALQRKNPFQLFAEQLQLGDALLFNDLRDAPDINVIVPHH